MTPEQKLAERAKLVEQFNGLRLDWGRRSAECWHQQGKLIVAIRKLVPSGEWKTLDGTAWVKTNLGISYDWGRRLSHIGTLPRLPNVELVRHLDDDNYSNVLVRIAKRLKNNPKLDVDEAAEQEMKLREKPPRNGIDDQVLMNRHAQIEWEKAVAFNALGITAKGGHITVEPETLSILFEGLAQLWRGNFERTARLELAKKTLGHYLPALRTAA